MSAPVDRDFRGFRPERFGRSGGGGAPLAAPFLLKADHWWDASYGYTLVSGKASSWLDKIRQADAIQAVAANRFVFSASGNSMPGPVMVADRANPDYMACTAGNGSVCNATGPYTIAATVHWGLVTTGTVANVKDAGTAGEVRLTLYNSGTGGVQLREVNDATAFSNAITGPNNVIANRWLIGGNDGAGNKEIEGDGVVRVTNAEIARPVTASTITIGALEVGATGLTGEIRDIVWWNRYLSVSERDDILKPWLDSRAGV